MIDVTTGEQPGEPYTAIAIPDAPASFSGIHEAARALSKYREKLATDSAQATPEPAAQESATPEPSDEADGAPPQEATAEDQAPDPVQDEPPLELPRSWTRDRAEHWAKLDRDTQQFLLDHDRKASAEVRRAQNEAAEKLKSITAKEQAAEQARQQYEQALPLVLKTLHQQQAGEFADIQSVADVDKMAIEDPFRFARFQAFQMKSAAIQQELSKTQERQTQEQSKQWSDFARRQDELLLEKVPDLADKVKAPVLQKAAVDLLVDEGFTQDELARMWNGQQSLSIRDARLQKLIVDGVRYREAQAKARTATAKPIPPVQRPGVSQGKAADRDAKIASLSQQLDKATGINALRLAAELTRAKRAG
jgi:hypothetical protein